MEERTLDMTNRERFEAWVLTGPVGRVWSFGRDVASALPMIARYWGGRLKNRRR